MIKLDFIESGNLKDFNKIIIFIHGWKGNKSSFQSLSSIMKIPDAKWIFPQAPYKMDNSIDDYSWSMQNSDGSYSIQKTVDLLNKFLQENILNVIDSKNVFFIGFSQGATVCYDLILQLKYPWGGVFPVAGFKRNQHKHFSIHPNQMQTPIVIGHGIKDDVIPIESSENIYNELKDSSNVIFEKFNGGHKISINYLKKIQQMING